MGKTVLIKFVLFVLLIEAILSEETTLTITGGIFTGITGNTSITGGSFLTTGGILDVASGSGSFSATSTLALSDGELGWKSFDFGSIKQHITNNNVGNKLVGSICEWRYMETL